jgi:hypothetical protein
MNHLELDRRQFLTGAAGAGVVLVSTGTAAAEAETKDKADDVPPPRI